MERREKVDTEPTWDTADVKTGSSFNMEVQWQNVLGSCDSCKAVLGSALLESDFLYWWPEPWGIWGELPWELTEPASLEGLE